MYKNSLNNNYDIDSRVMGSLKYRCVNILSDSFSDKEYFDSLFENDLLKSRRSDATDFDMDKDSLITDSENESESTGDNDTGVYSQDITEDYDDCSCNYGTFEESPDSEHCSLVMNLIKLHLCDTQISSKVNYFLPQDLISRIAEDVVKVSNCEPCGLKGCVLVITLQTLQNKDEVKEIQRIEIDRNSLSTFEMHITLVQDVKRWYSLKDLKKLIFPILAGCCDKPPYSNEIYLSSRYQLAKRKLYRTNSHELIMIRTSDES